MKKIKFIALLLMAVLSVNMMSAATKTIYCKMAQDWWKVDNAAVGCHSWGTGTGTAWPGVRMTPVQGETDLWSIDLDTDQVQNVIFTRFNPTDNGNLDWGAKTKDLTIPTDDKNLFTITSSSAVWGDPGCDGEWSVYGTSPVVTEPAVTDITITGDKYVGTELTFAATVAGFSAKPMVIYEVKAAEGEYAQAQGGKFTPTAAGNYTVKATAFYQPEEGDAEEAFKEVNFTVTEATVKEYYLVGYINGADSGCEDDYEALHAEYKFVDGQLKVTFTETSYVFVKTSDNSHWFLSESYVVPAAKVEATLAEGKAEKVAVNANVEVTFTITENQDGTLTLAYEEATPVETKYYAKNNWNGAALEDWSWLEMSATDQENFYMLDSVVFGGTGVNINDKEDDTDALWFAADAITVLDGLDGLPGPIPPKPQGRDTIPYAPAHSGVVQEAPQLLAGDTIKLFFNAADSTLSAAIVGRPEQPQPAKTFDLTIEQDTVWSKDDAKIAAWVWADDLEGQWTDWATDNEGTLTLKVDERADSIIFVRNAPEASEPTWDAWNRIDAGEIEDCHLFIITDWNEGAWCERPENPTELSILPYEENSKSLIQNSKLIKDGRLFIIREGKMYNAHGAIIK